MRDLDTAVSFIAAQFHRGSAPHLPSLWIWSVMREVQAPDILDFDCVLRLH